MSERYCPECDKDPMDDWDSRHIGVVSYHSGWKPNQPFNVKPLMIITLIVLGFFILRRIL